MKTVICCINSKYIHSSLAPWYLLAGVRKFATEPHEVSVAEATINQSPAEVAARLAERNAAVYAFCTYIWNIRFLKQILPLLKTARPDAAVVLGGPEVSFCPESVLTDMPDVSYILSGEGEESFPSLLDSLARGEEPTAVSGISLRTPNGVFSLPPKPLSDFPPNPFSAEYFRALNGRIAYIEGSRGCPFSCAFCLSGREDPLRLFPLERVKSDILRLANSGAKTVKFVDRTFNCHAARCREILRFLLSEYGRGIPTDICFHFEVAADLFDEETLALLATAPRGLFQMEAGLQSFHAETLAAVTRKTDMRRLCQNIRRILQTGNIHLHIDLIAGLPYEDIAIFKDSFDKAIALRPHMLQLGFLKLLHGSSLRRQITENGYLFTGAAPYEVFASRWMLKADFERLHRLEDVTERLYNSGRFSFTLEYLFAATGMSPFSLLDGFAIYLQKTAGEVAGISLDAYIAYVFRYFSALPAVDAARLRNFLICDCLCSKQTNRLPLCLFEKDKRTAKIARRLAEKNGSGIKRGVAILKAPKEWAAVVEYTDRDPVTGRFPLRLFEVDGLLLDKTTSATQILQKSQKSIDNYKMLCYYISK